MSSLLDYVNQLEQKSSKTAEFRPEPVQDVQQVQVTRAVYEPEPAAQGPKPAEPDTRAAQDDHGGNCKLDNIIDVLQYCKEKSLPARVVGSWVWLNFASKPAQDVRDGLKAAGFRWSRRRGQWAHNCGHPCRPSRSHKPWDKYQTYSADDILSGGAA